jgi:hypothetical protein
MGVRLVIYMTDHFTTLTPIYMTDHFTSLTPIYMTDHFMYMGVRVVK